MPTLPTQAGGVTDTTPPSTPANLAASAISSSAINLTWTASTDNVGVTGYKVFRAGVQVGTPTTNSYSDSGLTASTAYSYTVSANDAAGNNSAQSSSASATTQAVASGGGGGTSINIGETTVGSAVDNGNGNSLVAQNTTLSQSATIQSISFYVTTASGNLILGIYDATGPSGGPGALKAQTNSFTPVVGWNTVSVTSPVSLPAGTYWLAHLPSSSSLGYPVIYSGTIDFANYTFGPMPATFPTVAGAGNYHYSVYGTLSTP